MNETTQPAVAGPVEPTVRPCPFCGGTNGTDQMGETYRWRLWQCNECGAKGPEVRCHISGAGRGGEAEARQLALEAWNERAPVLKAALKSGQTMTELAHDLLA